MYVCNLQERLDQYMRNNFVVDLQDYPILKVSDWNLIEPGLSIKLINFKFLF